MISAFRWVLSISISVLSACAPAQPADSAIVHRSSRVGHALPSQPTVVIGDSTQVRLANGVGSFSVFDSIGTVWVRSRGDSRPEPIVQMYRDLGTRLIRATPWQVVAVSPDGFVAFDRDFRRLFIWDDMRRASASTGIPRLARRSADTTRDQPPTDTTSNLVTLGLKGRQAVLLYASASTPEVVHVTAIDFGMRSVCVDQVVTIDSGMVQTMRIQGDTLLTTSRTGVESMITFDWTKCPWSAIDLRFRTVASDSAAVAER